jgi:hypothetical protein
MADDDDDDDDDDPIDIFISHSSQDAVLARQVVDLLRSALTLRADCIRCTSVDGYRLAAGADTDDELRDEALTARLMIGVLSAFSMASAYVLFELGARWGAKKPLIPLLAPGVGPQALRGPLSSLNALSCESASQLHQLVNDVASALGVATESAAVYQHQIDSIIYAAHPSAPSESIPAIQSARLPLQASTVVAPTDQTAPTRRSIDGSNDYAASEQIIAHHCEREWPTDYSMRSYCIEQQRLAVKSLQVHKPTGVPEEIFAQIRMNCARDWPDDFSMRYYSERQQVEGYRKVHGISA